MLESNISRWIDKLGGMSGAQLRDEIATHVRKEFSTFDWILDGLLERAGFRILSKEMVEGVVGTYLRKKRGDAVVRFTVKGVQGFPINRTYRYSDY